MTLPAFKRLLPADYIVSGLENNAATSFAPLLACPIVDGRLLTGVALTTSPTIIIHRLGRMPQGYFLADINSNQKVWRTAWTDTTLTLQAQGTVTVSIWIF